MARTSIVPAFRQRLLDLVQAHVNVAGVTVLPAWDGRQTDREQVFFGDVQGTHQVPTMKSGRKTRREEFSLEVFVKVSRPGDKLQEAEERAIELMEALRGTLADDPTLGGLDGLIAATSEEFTELIDWTDENAAVTLRAVVNASAHLN